MSTIKSNQSTTETLDISALVSLFFKNWYYFAISVFITIVIAYGYNKVSPQIFEVSTSIVIAEENSGFANASAQILQDFGFFDVSKNFANEIQMIKSSGMVKQALSKLDLQISYFEHEKFQQKELYKNSPFIVVLDNEHPQLVYNRFFIEVIDQNKFRIYCESEEVTVYSMISNQGILELPSLKLDETASFNRKISSEHFSFKIILNRNYNIEELKGKTFSFYVNTLEGLINGFRGAVEVIPPDMESTVVYIGIKTAVPAKGIDFLTSLTDAYIEADLDKKRVTALTTVTYINNQLNIVGDSLRRAEQNLQRFRSRNEVVDITVQSGQAYQELQDLENQRAVLEINQKYYDYINEYFNSSNEFGDLIAPSAMGLEDPLLNNLIEELIRLNAERVSFIENNQEKSPYLKRINIRIENLRNMVSENISYYKQTNKIAVDDIKSRINQLNIEMRKIPQTERELFGIERKFNINDAIYTYLLEKRAEAEIAKASYQSDIELIEPAALVSSRPIAPRTKVNYIFALFVGVMVPFGIIQGRKLLQKSFIEKSEIARITDLPIIGEIPHSNKKVENVVESFPKSYISECFSKIRVNLDFYFKQDTGKALVINSSISSEGKSFVSLNLAQVLAESGSRTILLGFDLRKPRDYKPHTMNTQVGITSYLCGQAVLEDILVHTSNENLDIMTAGTIPPNPSMLITSKETKELIAGLKEEYDFIVIDAPPVGVVSDGYALMNQADLNIFVARLSRTPKQLYKELLEEFDKVGVKTGLIINDIPVKKSSKYGYGYYDSKSEK